MFQSQNCYTSLSENKHEIYTLRHYEISQGNDIFYLLKTRLAHVHIKMIKMFVSGKAWLTRNELLHLQTKISSKVNDARNAK